MDVSLIILAGGKSRRMGENKAFIPIGGVPVIERILHQLAPLVARIIIVSNQPQDFEDYPGIAVNDPDEYKCKGPLSGIYAGLKQSNSRLNLVAASDMPFVSPLLASYLLELLDEETDAVIPVANGKQHPLFAVYSRDCLGKAETMLKAQNYKMMDFLDHIRVKTVNEQNWRHLADPMESLLNMNTPADRVKAEKIAARNDK